MAGSRGFDNYVVLTRWLDKLFINKKDTHEITIISGGARGADKLGERYAKEHGYKVLVMPAEWDKYGKSAGYRRNEDMAKIATACVIFWDGESKGSKHMFDLAKKYDLVTRLINYGNEVDLNS